MCGIYGIFSFDNARPNAAHLERMAQATVHRGPDDQGQYEGTHLSMGMRRLAIIDLDGGHQPLSTGPYHLVCNGEIYNFGPLRKTLEAKGHQFRTHSDSESVLHAYAEWGPACVQHLNGMFGFALYDEKKERLFIARDHLGIKPIYYTVIDRQFIFASEAKAILALPQVQRAIDPTALDQYLRLGYVPAPYSLFKGIKKLPPATSLVVTADGLHLERYWRLPEHIEPSRSERSWIEETRDRVESSVRMQMASDVPLGAFLSGGVDSSAIVAFMAMNSDRPVQTYSIGFDTGAEGAYYSELPFAKQVAEQFGTRHREILVRPDVVDLVPRLLWHMDEPVADSAFITTYLVSEFARKDVTVILSGVGGDELYGGYRRYLGEHYHRLYQHLPAPLRKNLVTPLARRLPADRHSPLLNFSRLARSFLLSAELPFEERYRAYVGVFDEGGIQALMEDRVEEPYDALGWAFEDTKKLDPLRVLFEVDLKTQLPDDLLMLTDRMSMATSLECRVPLLDYTLVEHAARMPSKHKIKGRKLKHVLKESLNQTLPQNILHRSKRGFGAPMGAWLKSQLKGFSSTLLSPKAVRKRGLFRPEAVNATLAEHQSGQADRTDHLLALLNLEIWCRLYLDNQDANDLTEQIREEVIA